MAEKPNPDINDLVSKIRSGYFSPTTASSGKYGTIGFTPSVAPGAEQPTPSAFKAPPVLEGGINAASAILRGVTFFGRANLNLANEVVPYGNAVWKLTEDGLQPEELGEYLSLIGKGTAAGLGGFAKGALVSFMNPTEETKKGLQDFFGGKAPIEGAYDLFKSEDFAQAAKNAPALEEMRSEQKVGEIQIPFTDWKLPITKAGLYSFGWDVATDPFTWATMGLGGAVKGAGRGVSAAVKGSKVKAQAKAAGKEATVADLPAVAIPRPFYDFGGGKAEKLAPANVKYNVLNTSVPAYILKEMGRGFVESHKRALLVGASRRAAREAKGGMLAAITRAITSYTEKNGVPPTQERILAEFIPLAETEVFEQAATKLKNSGATNESNLETLLARTKGQVSEAVKSIVKEELPVVVNQLVDNAAAVAARAADENIPLLQAAEYQLADAFARQIPVKEPAIPRTRAAKYLSDELERFGQGILRASDPLTGDGKFGAAWEELKATDKTTASAALQAILSPLGYRTAARRAGKPDTEKVVEAIKGTKKARVTERSIATEELKEMKKRLRFRLQTIEGPKSESVAKAGKTLRVPSDTELLDAPRTALANLAKELGYEPNEALLKNIIDNPEAISGEMLERAVSIPSLAAERVRYMMERDVATPTQEVQLVQHLAENGYNPLTAETGTPKLRDFATTEAERRAGKGDRVATTTLSEVTRLAVQARGKDMPDRLRELTSRLGVKSNVLAAAKTPDAVEEVIHAAFLRKYRADYDKAVNELLTKQYGAVRASSLLNPEDMLTAEDTALLLEAEKLAAGAFRLQYPELDEAIELAAKMKDDQLAALEKLESIGISENKLAGRLIIDTLAARETAAIRRRAADATEGRIDSEELRQLTIIKGSLKAPALGETETELASKVFADATSKLKAMAASPRATDTSKELVKELLGVLSKQPSVVNQKIVRAVFSRMGNIVARYESGMSRSSVAGFDFAFTRRGGEYSNISIASFLARAYAGSASKSSMDGGAFADYIDRLLAQSGSKVALKDIKTHRDRVAALKAIVSEYGGEGITVPLLQDTIRAAENVGTRGTENLSGNTAFVKDVELAITRLFQNAENELAASNRLTPPSGSVGWIDRLPAESEKLDARAAISKFEVLVPEELWSAVSKKLVEISKAQPDNYAQILKATGKLNQRVTFAQISKLQELSNRSSVPLDGQLRRLVEYVVAEANKAAVRTVTKQRANVLVKQYMPSFVTKDALLAAADKVGRKENAEDLLHAKVILANILLKADIESALADNAASVLPKLMGEKTLAGLAKEQKRLTNLLNTLGRRFKQEGYADVPESVAEKSLDEVLAMENPLAVVRKIASMKVVDQKSADEWQTAMRHLLDLSVTGKGRAYKNYKELLDSYRSANDLRVGETNPVTGRPVPDEFEVLETLKLLGGATAEKAEKVLKKNGKPPRKTVLAVLKQAEERITSEELVRARNHDYIREVNVAGGAEVRDMVAALPDALEMQKNLIEDLTQMRLDLEKAGLGWVETLAMRMVGTSVKGFFTDRFKFLKRSYRDGLGRILDTAGEVTADGKKVSGSSPDNLYDMKRTWEDYTNYTGFKTLMQSLDDMAESKGLVKGTIERGLWVRQHAMLAMRLRDKYLLSRGIVPQKTIAASRNEAKYSNIADLFKDGRKDPVGVSVYLSEADIMDMFPVESQARLFFMGREFAFPPTALLPAARLLVAAIDNLPSKADWFNAEQLEALGIAMVDSSINEGWKASISQFSKVPLAALNEEAVSDMVTTIVRSMLEPSNGLKLYEQHLLNATFAMKILKYNADEIAEPIMSAWRQIVESPISSSGDKMQATAKAFEALDNVLGQENLAPEQARLMATLDMQVMLASEIDLDSFISLQEAWKISKAGRTGDEVKELRKEIREIQKIQKKSQKTPKEIQDKVTDALLETAEARTKMLDSIYASKVAKAVERGIRVDEGMSFDVFNETYTNVAFHNWGLNFLAGVDNWAEKLFFDYKMENLRPIYGGMERTILEEGQEYENLIVKVAAKWQKLQQQTGRNYPAEAFAILQKIDDENLPKMMLNADIFMKAIKANAADAGVKADPAAVREMMDFSSQLKQFFPENEPQLLEAAVDLWSAGGHLFGGGAMSKIARSGLPPRWLNMQIKMMGSAEARQALTDDGTFVKLRDGFGFNPSSADSTDMAKMWREWEIDSPFQMFVGLNSAIGRASKVPYAAAEIMRNHGVRLADFRKEGESLTQAIANAKAEGYVVLKEQATLTPGRELLFFMNTKDYVYRQEIAQELGVFSKFLTEPYHQFEAIRRIAQRFEGIQNFAKQSMTILRPGNWLMNLVGGFWTNFIQGVTSPAAYARAMKMMRQGSIDLSDIGVDPKSIEGEVLRFFSRRAQDGFVIKESNNPLSSETVDFVSKGKVSKISYADLWELYKRVGAQVPTAQSREYDLVGQTGTADTLNKGLSRNVLTKGYNNLVYKLGRGAALRDDWLRATMWIDELTKNNWAGSLEDAAKDALKRVDRAHPQMQDLSKFNSEVTRQIILFFTWRAKTLAWILYDILDKPGRLTVPLKAQYALEVSQGDQPEYFGSMDVPGMPIRNRQQGNLDLTTPGNEFTFSVANPVTDLLGSSGWLSGISFNSYDSLGTQAITSSMRTLENFLYSSTPLVATAILDWGRGQTSSGRDLTSNGISVTSDVPYFIEDIMGQLGLGPAHIILAQVMPDIFKRATWEGESGDKKRQDMLRTFVSWATGTRPRELDTVENREKALREIFSKIAELQQEQFEKIKP